MKQVIHQCDGIGDMAVFICSTEEPDRVKICQMGEEITISHENLPIFLQQLKMYADSVGVKS